jgi:hypothetical protein
LLLFIMKVILVRHDSIERPCVSNLWQLGVRWVL